MNRTASIARTILVVDDDSALRNTLIEILEEEGYRASSASNGEEALEVLRRQGPQPSLILLDMMMPVMDGWGFREEQQKDQTLSGIPVVIFSAQGNVNEMAASVSASAYLKKPLLLKELLEVVGRFCGEGALSA
ncbi:MAG TPA: response regulator [Myxococcales bacterium]